MTGKRQSAVADSASSQELLALVTVDDGREVDIVETEVEASSPLAWSIESARLMEEAYRIDRSLEDHLRALEAELERARDENARLEARMASAMEARDENAVLAAKLQALESLGDENEALHVRIAQLDPLRDENAVLQARLTTLENVRLECVSLQAKLEVAAEENASLQLKLELLEPLSALLDSVWESMD